MRAALLEQPETPLVVVDDVDIEAPRIGEVLVRIVACGVCHSDLHFVNGHRPLPMPAILGHEAAGIIEEVGPGVSTLQPGDKVVLTMRPSCGVCPFCVRGEQQLCAALGARGGKLPDGTTRLSRNGSTVYRGLGIAAMAEYVVTAAVGAIKVPDDTPLEVACVIGCAVQTGFGAAVNSADIQVGDTALVVGLGGIGISVVQGARLAGASRVIGVDRVPERREQARQFGVTDVVDPDEASFVEVARDLTDGLGVDWAFEAVGSARLVESCLQAVRPGGSTIMIGGIDPSDHVNIPASSFLLSERRLRGCFLGSSHAPREFPRLLALWRTGKLDLEAMITAVRPLDEVNEAFDDMRAGRGLRTVLTMGSPPC